MKHSLNDADTPPWGAEQAWAAVRIMDAAKRLAWCIEEGEREGLTDPEIADLLADDALRAIYMDRECRDARPR